ncbi:hypothetical protein Goklo_006532 [Gossypium klotzschianum]|uniref:Aminotransferase-like plant mobile domain-containing protein n=1 Tax=Gossypium klotzschianum TaxID=34286 RepID=A0A7J8VIH2_9ROSI|nr:hypothetical protein [Gossypium klotzschianum]
MRWLEENFQTIEASINGIEKEQLARAFIFKVDRGSTNADKSCNLVHLRWLLLLVSLKELRRFSLGSVVMATLYREMYRATIPDKAKIDDCMLFFQSWAWYRLSFLHPRVELPYEFPLIIW